MDKVSIPKATIFIPTYNGGEFLEELLKMVATQKVPFEYEVFIIDSGSQDSTLDIIKKSPEVRLHQIPNEEFGHGKTRQLAAEMSDSEFMVYITQDAVPENDSWLNFLIEPFYVSDKVAAVLGRQIPRHDCNITVKREVTSVFNSLGSSQAISLHRAISLLGNNRVDAPNYLSDVNAAYRRELLIKELPFRDLDYAEDQAIGQEILDKGYLKAYAPLGAVRHSHNFTVRQYFYRKFDETIGLKASTGQVPRVSMKELVLGTSKATVRDWIFLLKDRDYTFIKKIAQFFKAPFYNLAVRMAIIVADRSSKGRGSRFSLEKKQKK